MKQMFSFMAGLLIILLPISTLIISIVCHRKEWGNGRNSTVQFSIVLFLYRLGCRLAGYFIYTFFYWTNIHPVVMPLRNYVGCIMEMEDEGNFNKWFKNTMRTIFLLFSPVFLVFLLYWMIPF